MAISVRYPFEGTYQVTQTSTGSFSHTENPTNGVVDYWVAAYDFGLPIGTPILAVAPGIIVDYRQQGEPTHGLGTNITVLHNPGTSNEFYGTYAHLEANSVLFQPSDRGTATVVEGERLGLSGDTGVGTGPHLHFQFSDTSFVHHSGDELARATDAYDFLIDFNGNTPNQWQSVTGAPEANSTSGPDLIAVNFGVSDSSPNAGDTIDVAYTIENIGTGTAIDTTAGIYISTNSLISTGDTLLGSQLSTTSNNAGSIDNESEAITLPSGLSPGTYYIGIVADYDNQETSETSESNNNSSGTAITITAPTAGPDLIARNFTADKTTVAIGEQIDFDWIVENIGDADALGAYSGVYLSSNSIISTGDRLLHDETMSATMNPSETDPESDLYTVESDIAPGTYYVGVLADNRGAVSESNEGNNVSNSFQITITAPVQDPDLTISNTSLSSSSILEGGSFDVSYDVNNIGSGDAPSTFTRLVVSTDTVLDTGDVATIDLAPTISAGGTYSGTTTVDLSAFAPGNYYMIAVADHSDTASESDETNNVGAAIPFTISADSQPGYSLSENFDDGILNQSPWSYQFDVVETGGELLLSQSTTDQRSRAFLDLIDPVLDAQVSFDAFYHAEPSPYSAWPGYYFLGDSGFNLLDVNGNDINVGLIMMRSDYGPNYGNDPANYDLPRLTLNFSDGTSSIVNYSSGANTSTYLDNSTRISFELDSTNGVIEIDLEDDGTSEFSVTDTRLIGSALDDLHLGTYGWWTGHYTRVDNLQIDGETTVSNNLPTNGPDSLDGTSGDDTIDGLSGDDTINGGGGNDSLIGGAGIDQLFGDAGDDTLDGSAGADALLDGGTGNDSILGGGGNDTLSGGADNDTLRGGSNNDSLDGGSGNDRMFGEIGMDTLTGGDGDDYMTGGNSNDQLMGDAGMDTLLGQGSSDTLMGGDDDDSLDGGASADVLYGDAGNDTLKGGAFNDVLHGGAGNDLLDGGTGLDTLNGDGGNDTLLGGTRKDELNGGDGDDSLDGGIGVDILNGDAGNDTLLGGSANDTLDGGAGADVVMGGSGSDLFYVAAGEGGDTLTGDAGNDVFDFETGFGTAVITDFTGADEIDLVDVAGVSNFGDLTISYGTDALIDLGGGDTITLIGVTGGLEGSDFGF